MANYHLDYTEDQQRKISENLDQIKGYLLAISSELEGLRGISTEFKRGNCICRLTVCDGGYFYGSIGYADISFDKKPNSSRYDSVYTYYSYAIPMIMEWPSIKRDLLDKVEKRKAERNDILTAIESFEV